MLFVNDEKIDFGLKVLAKTQVVITIMNSLTIVCKDGSVSTIENIHLDRLGTVLEGLFEISSTPVINLGHLFETSTITKPLESYFKGGDAFLDLVVDDKDDALAICYEAAFGELNIGNFVDMVDHEAYRILEDDEKHKSDALFSLPTIAVMKKVVLRKLENTEFRRYSLWTRSKLRSAAATHDVVVMLTGFKEYIAVFNFERSMEDPLWFEWAMSTSEKENDNFDDFEPEGEDADKAREQLMRMNPDKKKYLVFKGCAWKFVDYLLSEENEIGLWDYKDVFNNLLRKKLENSSYVSMYTETNACKYKCVDKLEHQMNVSAAAHYDPASFGMVYAKDVVWDHIATTEDNEFNINMYGM